MTGILIRSNKRTIGQEIYIKAWRQIAVSLAIKFFGSENLQLDFDLTDDADDDPTPDKFNPRLLPEAVHWRQYNHTPRTGNQNYGGTIDFKQGLTDASLQEYLLVSKEWFRLLRPRVTISAADPRKHVRAHGNIGEISLVKRVAFRDQPPRYYFY